MKFNFRKISAIGASLLMTGMTMGVAAAANYPAPFVSGGSANVAVVYGTGSGVSSLDMVEAGNIQSNLASGVSSGATSSSSSVSGESVLLERSTDKLNLGNDASTVFVTSVDDDDLPTLLAEGTYTDDDNTEFDYTQKVTLGSNLGLEHFADSDYNNEAPTVGIKLSDDQHVLNYTIDFTTHPAFNATDMETTTLTLMGKEYYVLDVHGVGDSGTQNTTTLLDTASSAIISEGETATVQGKSVSIAYISSTEVKLNVGGQTTNSLAEGGTYKLSDGTYVGIKDILYDSKDSGISKVEFSIGTGKLEITSGETIELNDDTIEEIKVWLIQDSSYKLDKIVVQWTTDDEAFITADSEIIMPAFEALKVSFGGFVVPGTEETKVEASGSDVIRLTTTIKSGATTIDLLGANSSGNFQTIGKDSTNRLVTSTSTALYFNETAGDKYIVGSWNSTTEAESYYLELSVTTENNVDKLQIKDKVTGDTKKIANASDASFGSVVLTLQNITRDGSKKWAHVTINSGGSFNTLYTAEGMKLYLPYFVNSTSTAEGAIQISNTTQGNTGQNFFFGHYSNATIGSTAGHGHVSYYQYLAEEDKDGNLAAGNETYVVATESGTSNKVHVDSIDTSLTGYEIGDSDDFEYYVISDLATKILHDTGGDQDFATITYAGEQSYGELYLTAPDASVSGGSSGVMLVKDTEVSSVSSKNLIVVGGSCINSAAASLVGGAYCGSAWTTATGVGSGQFLIKSYSGSSLTSSGKIALLVAGYEAADTVNAATYLRTQTVDTSKEYKGTSSTSADLVVA